MTDLVTFKLENSLTDTLAVAAIECAKEMKITRPKDSVATAPLFIRAKLGDVCGPWVAAYDSENFVRGQVVIAPFKATVIYKIDEPISLDLSPCLQVEFEFAAIYPYAISGVYDHKPRSVYLVLPD